MQYFGGKHRIAKQIGAYLDRFEGPYLEPFCGAAWVANTQLHRKRIILSDACYPLIAMYKALAAGWIPPIKISEERYAELKAGPPCAEQAFAGFGCSFAGKWFGGYARNKRDAPKVYANNARNSLAKMLSLWQKAEYISGDFAAFDPTGFVIYCDPPYAGTTGYAAAGRWNPERFWQQVREWSLTNTVFVSEYNAPDDFDCVLEIATKTEIRTANGREPRSEKLFKWRHQ